MSIRPAAESATDRADIHAMGLPWMIQQAAAELFTLNLVAEQSAYDRKATGEPVLSLYYANGRLADEASLKAAVDPQTVLDNTRALFKTQIAAGNDVILWREFPTEDPPNNGLMRVAFVPLAKLQAFRSRA